MTPEILSLHIGLFSYVLCYVNANCSGECGRHLVLAGMCEVMLLPSVI